MSSNLFGKCFREKSKEWERCCFILKAVKSYSYMRWAVVMFKLHDNSIPGCLLRCTHVIVNLCSSSLWAKAMVNKSGQKKHFVWWWEKCLSKCSLIKHTCSWCDKLIVSWTLNRQAKIFLRIETLCSMTPIFINQTNFTAKWAPTKLKLKRKKKKTNFMAPFFYGWGSTASRLQPLRGGSLLFTIQFPEISSLGSH